MIFRNTLVALALALSASALTTSHVARSVHQHRGLAARLPHPDPVAQPEFVQVTPPKKRSNSGRCKTRSSSSAVVSSTAVSSAVNSTSVAATSTVATSTAAPVNVAPPPPTFSSSSSTEAPKTTSSSEPPKTTSTPPPPPKTTSEAAPPKTTSASSSSGSSGDEPSFLDGTQHGDGKSISS